MATIEQKINETLHLVDQLNETKTSVNSDPFEKLKSQLKDMSETQECFKQASMAPAEEIPFSRPTYHSNKSHSLPSLSQYSHLNQEELVQQMIHDFETICQHELSRYKSSNEKLKQQQQNLIMENRDLKKNAITIRRKLELSMQEERLRLLEKIRDLENENLELTKLPFQPLSEEQFRTLQQQTTEQQIYIHQMQTEIEDLRAAKTELEMEHSNSIRALQRQINDLTIQCDTLHSAKGDYAQQVSDFQEELHTWVLKNKDLQQQNTQLQLEVNDHKNRLEDNSHAAQQELFILQSKYTQAQSQYDKKINEAHLNISMLQDIITALEQKLDEKKKEIEIVETNHKEQFEGLQKEKEELLRRAQHGKTELSEELNGMKKEMDQYRKSHALEVEVLTKKLSDISIHSREVSAEKISLVKKIEELESQLFLEREHKRKILDEFKESENRLQATHDDVAALRTAMSWTRPQYEEEKKKNQELREQIAQLQSTLQHQREEYSSAMEQAKNTWSRTVLELNENLENAAKEKMNFEELCSKIKRAAQRKVLQYKSELERYQASLKEAQNKIEQLQVCLEAKHNSIERENVDFSIQRDRLLSFLQKEIQEFPKCSNSL